MLIGLVSVSTCPAQSNVLTEKEKADGWRLLFDGTTLDEWVAEGDARWRVADGRIIGDAGGDGWLRSREVYADFAFVVEFRNVPRGNSGIFLRAENKGRPYPAPEHGYELQIYNEEPKYATGSIEDYIQRLRVVNPKPDEWHRFEVEARGPRFAVRLDGEKVLEGTSDAFRSGYLGLQYHQDSKIEFRNLKVRPLKND